MGAGQQIHAVTIAAFGFPLLGLTFGGPRTKVRLLTNESSRPSGWYGIIVWEDLFPGASQSYTIARTDLFTNFLGT